MKSIGKLLCFLLTVPALLFGCGEPVTPADTETTVADTFADSDQVTGETTAPAEVEKIPFDPEEDPYRGTVVNIDGDAIYYMSNYFKGDLTDLPQKCEAWFNRLYKDAGISDLIYNVDFVVPTELHMEYQDFYMEAKQKGETAHETTEKLGKLYDTVFNEMQMDPYEIWFGLCRENGINPWMSFRMNDTHFPHYGYGYDEMFYKAKENGWHIGMEAGVGAYKQWCLDYSVPEVRAYYSEYIDEHLGKHDVYGIELDWQRNIHCFKTESVDNCQYMNLFIQEINRIVEKYEAEYGHDIKIMVRLSRDLDQNMYYGFDLRTWAENGWFDVAVPAPRSAASDSDMPIEVWKEALSPYGIEVYACVESTVVESAGQTPQTLAAYTSMYLQRGADKMYLYNLFGRGPSYYKVCSSLSAAHKSVKRSYVVAHQDTVPKLKLLSAYKPLPVQVRVGEQTEPIVLRHGRLCDKWDTYIYVGIPNKLPEMIEETGLTVTYNGVVCEYQGEAYKPLIGTGDTYRSVSSFKIPKDAWVNAESGEIVFSAEQFLMIGYIEVMNGNPSMG